MCTRDGASSCRPAAVGAAPSPKGRVFSDLASSCLAYGAFVDAIGAAPSPDGRVFPDLASSCLAYGEFVALRSSASGLAHRSVGYSSHLLNFSIPDQSVVSGLRPCFVDASFNNYLFQPPSRLSFFAPICPEILRTFKTHTITQMFLTFQESDLHGRMHYVGTGSTAVQQCSVVCCVYQVLLPVQRYNAVLCCTY